VRHVAILLVLILGVPACRPSAEPEELAADQLGQTELADRGPEEATAAAAIGPSASPTPLATATPNPPSPTAQLVTTQVSTADPSDSARLLRGRTVAPAPPGSTVPTSILFVSTRDGVPDLYRMSEDGTGQVRLTQNGRNNDWPSWSPDGQQIGFLSSEVGGDRALAPTHLYVMNADGTGSVDITPHLDQLVESLAWSPEGQRLALVANPAPEEGAFAGTNVFVVNRDGSGLAQISHMEIGSVGCWSPTWSPDGSRLAYVCRALMSVGIVIASADGAETWGMDYWGQINRVFWLPSGDQVGFTDGVCGRVGVISAEFLLTNGASSPGPWPCLDQDFEALEANLDSPYRVVWSPQLDTLFAVQTAESIQIVDLARYAITVAALRSDPLSGPPSWSPDGSHLAFAAEGGNDSEIFVLDLMSQAVVQLTDNDVEDLMPAWQP